RCTLCDPGGSSPVSAACAMVHDADRRALMPGSGTREAANSGRMDLMMSAETPLDNRSTSWTTKPRKLLTAWITLSHDRMALAQADEERRTMKSKDRKSTRLNSSHV